MVFKKGLDSLHIRSKKFHLSKCRNLPGLAKIFRNLLRILPSIRNLIWWASKFTYNSEYNIVYLNFPNRNLYGKKSADICKKLNDDTISLQCPAKSYERVGDARTLTMTLCIPHAGTLLNLDVFYNEKRAILSSLGLKIRLFYWMISYKLGWHW